MKKVILGIVVATVTTGCTVGGNLTIAPVKSYETQTKASDAWSWLNETYEGVKSKLKGEEVQGS